MAERIAVVTGANKGLGFDVVKGLCQKFDGKVYLTARDEKRGLDAVKKLNDLGFNPLFHLLDVSDSNSIQTFADFIKTNHGGFDVLVYNAAILELDQIYPTYDEAKRNIDVHYTSLLKIEEYLYPLLRDLARVVNVSIACGHLLNLKKNKWYETFKNKDLTTEEVNDFINEYLESVKNGTVDDFVNDVKHAEHRVSKIALSALTMIHQRKYFNRNISINAVHPGHVNTDMACGLKETLPDEAAKLILYLILEASPNIKGAFFIHKRKIIDWYDTEDD